MPIAPRNRRRRLALLRLELLLLLLLLLPLLLPLLLLLLAPPVTGGRSGTSSCRDMETSHEVLVVRRSITTFEPAKPISR